MVMKILQVLNGTGGVTVYNNYHTPEPDYSDLYDPYNYTNENPSYDFDEPREDPPVTSPEDPPTEEPKPDSGCEEVVADKLKSITQSSFKEILNKFSGSNSLYKVNIIVGSLGGDPDLARTSNSGTYRTYNITLNENYSNATSLSIAASLVHEYIHAYFNTIFDDYTNNHNTHAYDNYPFLYEAYVNGNGDKQAAHHDQIAASFIDLMAATLQEFQTGVPVAVGSADSFYKDMAWGTMQGTYAYNSNTYINQEDRDRIGPKRAAETYNQQTGENTPKGTPCNK